MTKLYWLLIGEEKSFAPFEPICEVRVGATKAEQALLQKVTFYANAHPLVIYFRPRTEESQSFIHKLVENEFHPILQIKISVAWSMIQKSFANPSNRKKTHV